MRNILALVLFALLSIPMDAAACSCVPPGTVQQERDQSTRVFVGRVTSIERRTPETDKGWLTVATEWIRQLFGATPHAADRDFPYKRVSFAVTETFKGTPESHVELGTGMGGGDCGYVFEPGKEYVVYARGQEGALDAGICSLTGPSSESRSGLQVLRNGG